jgi:hypothetical protein
MVRWLRGFAGLGWTYVAGTILGLVATALLLLAGGASPLILDAAEAIALFVPDRLGLVDHVAADEFIYIGATGDHPIHLARSGAYRVYSPYPLIDRTIVTVTTQGGRPVPVIPLYAPDPFDPLTADDPQYAFDIGAAGAYTVTVGSFQPEIALTIQPYVGDQNAAVAVLCGSVQCAAALLAAGLVYRRLTRAQRLAHAADQQARRDRMATFLDDPGRRKPK